MKDVYVDIPFPVKGLDEGGPFARQPPLSTADCQNVQPFDPLTGRLRGAQRGGLVKHLDDQISGSTSIQEITHCVADASSVTPFASFAGYIRSGANQAWFVIDQDGAVYDQKNTGGPYMGTFDSAGNLYQVTDGISSGTAGMVVKKYSLPNIGTYTYFQFDPTLTVVQTRTLATQQWATTLNTSDNEKDAVGIAISGGILYVFGKIGNSGAIYNLWRLDPQNGGIIGGGAWLNSDLSTTAGAFAYNDNTNLAAGKDYLALVVYNSATDLILHIINKSTAAITSVTIGTSATVSVHDIAMDDSDNVYVAYGLTSDTSTLLRKYSSAGALQWTATASTVISGVCYDRYQGKLFACGDALMGGTNTVAEINVSTGAVTTGVNLDSTSWISIRPDGRGRLLVSKAGRAQLINSSLAEVWDKSIYTNGIGWQTTCATGWESTISSAPGSRVIRSVAIADGDVVAFDRSGTVPATSGNDALDRVRPVIFTAQNGLFLYLADGANAKRYAIASNTVGAWTPTTGSLPTGNSRYGRLICTWRGRTVISGLESDPQNWFMSRVDDPLDWDYAQDDEKGAVAGNNSPAGLIGDLINTLIPWSDDLLLFGGDHSLWRMSGDPMAGGRIDRISDITGTAWGMKVWCKDSLGTIYFYGSRNRVYKMNPNGLPEPISLQIERKLEQTDLSKHIISMAWDDANMGCYLFVTPLLSTETGTHWWYDARNESWWPILYTNNDHQPKTVHVFDGDDPNDRVILLGSWDGYIRFHEPTADDDDGKAIKSHVLMGPVMTKGPEGTLFKDVQIVLGENSDEVTWSVQVGNSAQQAVKAKAAVSGKLKAGRNRSQLVRRHGHAAYLKLSNTTLDRSWQYEAGMAVLAKTGKVRQRAF